MFFRWSLISDELAEDLYPDQPFGDAYIIPLLPIGLKILILL
jgi:hypothetical protein